MAAAVTNLLPSKVSYFRLTNWWADADELPPYPDDTYRGTRSGTTPQLRDADSVVERLVRLLNRTITPQIASPVPGGRLLILDGPLEPEE